MPGLNLGAALDLALARVEPNVGVEVATCGREIQRLQAEHGIAHLDARVQLPQRLGMRQQQGVGMQGHVGIKGTPALGIKGDIGQHAHRSPRCADHSLATRAHHRGQIVQIEPLRTHLTAQEGARPCAFNLQAASHVTAPHPAREFVVAPDRALAHQVTGGDVVVSAGQPHAQQRKQRGEAVTPQVHAQIHRRQRQQAGHLAFGPQMGGADAGLDLERIGRALITQGQHRPAAALRGQGLTLKSPGGLEH